MKLKFEIIDLILPGDEESMNQSMLNYYLDNLL